MLKQRRLLSGQEIIIIYDKTGFIEKTAYFNKYEYIQINKVNHEIPVFDYNDKKITGLDCFWILPNDVKDINTIHNLQYNLLKIQVEISKISNKLGYNIEPKIKDKEIKKMAKKELDREQHIIAKLGFDPTDTSWIENELSTTTREKKWFHFEREYTLDRYNKWDDMINIYNNQFEDNISIEEAKSLSKKWYRFILGSYNIRFSGEQNKEKWKQQAKEFEKNHREREIRMKEWTAKHIEHFPHVRTKKQISFFIGSYFNECVEKIPQLFTDVNCNWLKPGNILQVVSYDPKLKFIKLDFTDDIIKIIKNTSSDVNASDYDIWLKPENVETHLEFLESLY